MCMRPKNSLYLLTSAAVVTGGAPSFHPALQVLTSCPHTISLDPQKMQYPI